MLFHNDFHSQDKTDESNSEQLKMIKQNQKFFSLT